MQKSIQDSKIMYKLYIMCGIPGSGKSTFAKILSKNLNERYPVISRDTIRYNIIGGGDYFSKESEVFSKFIDTIDTCAKKYGGCIIDATHIDMYSRRKLFRAIDRTSLRGKYETSFYVMDTPLDVCIMHNDLRDGRANVPHNIIENMATKMTKPNFNEHNSIETIYIMRIGKKPKIIYRKE